MGRTGTLSVVLGVGLMVMPALAQPTTKPGGNQATTKPAKILPRMAAAGPVFVPREEPDVRDLQHAIKLLTSPVEADRMGAARWLSVGKSEDKHREKVLKLLEPSLQDVDPKRGLVFVQAYANWADHKHVAELASVLDTPVRDGMPAATERCWAAALEGLVRIDAAEADKAMVKRIDVFFFRTEAQKALRPLADSGTEVAKPAQRMIDALKLYKSGPRRPVDPPVEPPKSNGPNV